MKNTSCPVSGNRGKAVPCVTLRSLVLPARLAAVEDREWFFCDRPECEVVYFSGDGRTLDKEALSVRVGLKEREAPRPVCYCFDHTVESIREEITRTGRSTAAASIRKRIEAGECRCEVLNPKGTCCLGDVDTVVKEVLVHTGVPRAPVRRLSATARASDACGGPAARGEECNEDAGCLPEPVRVQEDR